MARAKTKEEALLDELLKDYSDPKEILGENGLLKQLQKKLVERVLDAELAEHLGYTANSQATGTNRRNGKGRKTIQSDSGQFDIETPRDRDGSFEPQIVKAGRWYEPCVPTTPRPKSSRSTSQRS